MIETYAKNLTIYRLSSLVKWDSYKGLINISANNHAINALKTLCKVHYKQHFSKDTLSHKIEIYKYNTVNVEASHIIITGTIVCTIQEISLAWSSWYKAIIPSTKRRCAYTHNFWGRFYYFFLISSLYCGGVFYKTTFFNSCLLEMRWSL